MTQKEIDFIFDEHTSGLDAVGKQMVLGLLFNLKKDKLVIIVSHDIEIEAKVIK